MTGALHATLELVVAFNLGRMYFVMWLQAKCFQSLCVYRLGRTAVLVTVHPESLSSYYMSLPT